MRITAILPKEDCLKAGFYVPYGYKALTFTGKIIEETPKGVFIRTDDRQTRFIPTRFITNMEDELS